MLAVSPGDLVHSFYKGVCLLSRKQSLGADEYRILYRGYYQDVKIEDIILVFEFIKN